MSDRDEVLFANEAFYLCFAGGDAEGMDGVWARGAAVTCIHPGWEALSGRDAVMASWRSIIEAGSPNIQCSAPEVSLYGDAATVICFEDVDGGFLIATNVFVREEGTWRMVHHQAGPTRGAPPPEDAGRQKPTVN